MFQRGWGQGHPKALRQHPQASCSPRPLWPSLLAPAAGSPALLWGDPGLGLPSPPQPLAYCCHVPLLPLNTSAQARHPLDVQGNSCLDINGCLGLAWNAETLQTTYWNVFTQVWTTPGDVKPLKMLFSFFLFFKLSLFWKNFKPTRKLWEYYNESYINPSPRFTYL